MARSVLDEALSGDKSAQAWLKSEAGKMFAAEFGSKASAEKRKRTMSLGHHDMNEAPTFKGRGLGFDGDWENGEGELVATVNAEQEGILVAMRQGKFKKRRGRRGGRKVRRK